MTIFSPKIVAAAATITANAKGTALALGGLGFSRPGGGRGGRRAESIETTGVFFLGRAPIILPAVSVLGHYFSALARTEPVKNALLQFLRLILRYFADPARRTPRQGGSGGLL